MYSITLSHDAMKTIRNYNSNSNYLDYSLNCDENLRCTSTFLNEFRAKYSNLFSKNVNIPSNNLYYYKRSWQYMKETFWSYLFIVLGLLTIAIMILVQNLTSTSEENYYLTK